MPTDVYYTYLENEVLSKSQYRKHHIYLVRATMAYYIRHQNGLQCRFQQFPDCQKSNHLR
jgi:hypothetical protein